MGCSILTLNKNRDHHLKNLILGLTRSVYKPDELIIIHMGDTPFIPPKTDFPISLIRLNDTGLPLAKARNCAVSHARYEKLIFLDVDCIPASNLIATLEQELNAHEALISAEVLYLPQGATLRSWCETKLRFMGKPHPVRPFPKKGLKTEENRGLFWSLCFACSRDIFKKIGGFCEEYQGYGAEDTDFSFCAAAYDIPHLLTAQTYCFHQYHPCSDPPIEHFRDIIKNARIFYKRWKTWPMQGWLQAFAERSLIKYSATEIIVLKTPEVSTVSTKIM